MDKDQLKQMRRGFRQAVADFFEKHFPGGQQGTALLEPGTGNPDIAEQLKEALKPFEQKFSEIEKRLDEEKKARDAAASTTAIAGQAAFAEKQMQRVKDQGRWIPAFDKMGLPQIFAELSKSPGKVSFGEGDKKQEKPIAEVFADFMCALPKIVPLGEIAAAGAGKGGAKVVQFNEPVNAHTVIDQGSVSMAEAARKLSQEKNIPYGDALTQVRRSGQYAPDGGAAAGVV